MGIFQKISVPWKEFMLKHSGKKELKLLHDIKNDIVKKYNEEKESEKETKDNKEVKNEDNINVVTNKVSNVKKLKEDSKEIKNNTKKFNIEDESFPIVLVSFIFSELKEAFAMSVSLLIPFLVIDIIVANILVGLGMYMLTPSLVSLPIKILIFVLIDGWLLLGKSLILSFGM